MAKKSPGKTVLVIEDEPSLQNFFSRVLELEGYRVLKADDGTTGINLINDNTIDLLLLDIRLPGPDGWSILREIKENSKFSQIPVIVLTAIADSAQRRRTLRMGATQYLVKPLSAHSLSKTVADILNQRSANHRTGSRQTAPVKQLS
jgi:DNA-binding response OmpR family regulator